MVSSEKEYKISTDFNKCVENEMKIPKKKSIHVLDRTIISALLFPFSSFVRILIYAINVLNIE